MKNGLTPWPKDIQVRHDSASCPLIPDSSVKEKDSLPVIRIATGKTVEEVLAQDLHILIWMPPPFIKFARELIQEISADFPNLELGKILEETWPIDEQKLNEYNESDNLREQEPLSLVIFRLSSTTMYQQLDRRLDESVIIYVFTRVCLWMCTDE